MIIRHLHAQDYEPWSALWRGYLNYYETELPENIYQSSFERMLRGNGGADHEFQGLVGEQDGKLVGLVHYLFHRHGWKMEDVCYLQDLYTDPSVRGQGIGRALIEAVYQQADSKGAPDVYWLTQDFNTEGRRLYDKVGQLTPFIKYKRP